jgi:hypothetical protein
MPTTLGGLLVFVLLMVPGFVHYVQRRSRVPQRELSPLVETATVATVSIATTSLALVVFAMGRVWVPEHLPDVTRLIDEGSSYIAPRPGYVLGWSAAVVLLSSLFAFVLAARVGPVGRFASRFTPALVDVSAWYQVFEGGPEDARVYLGCDLHDGSYMGGTLDWYSTEVKESAHRDLVLAAPITFRATGDPDLVEVPGVSRVILSAREMARLYVSYVDTPVASR